ncbi:MBL fold metallo-hydrolase [Camelliibacillus cellulosilyticus]|uniref:MBL fold metallo-hydrolase n=1 Tax=Camelliibacillus cellulosilyticus TaxID=2174486 RepID=A0ABV9GPE5_9BACL
MKVRILGGGSEIGASCLHIEMAGTSLIIDAGMRMHGENVLPAFGMLEHLPRPEAILVTHAHADHIGALPVLHTLYPDAPIYATPPTRDLMALMMRDAYKILKEQTAAQERLMPYTETEMKQALETVRFLPANNKMKIGDLSMKVYRAGHILGAVMFLIEGGGERLLVTGDLSFRGGRTIPSAQVPPDVHPDVVVMESTYGNRLHTDRHTEEKRLAENVAEVVEAGGFALIPAFALGRAQEVLLVLQDYMDRGLIPEFPIYVDGLVTPVSRIYRDYPQFLKGPVRHRIQTHGDAFLTEGRCIAVGAKEREKVISGKPACIVASSGMLTGGASAWYAEKLVSESKNAIFITGYQDEESPGRKLLALADGEDNKLEINGSTYEVACRVDKYGLSAHADATEMTRFIETLEPTHTLLVHGDDDARDELARRIDAVFNPMLVENGETYAFEKRRSGQGVVGKRRRQDPDRARLHNLIGSVVLYKGSEEDAFKTAICMNVHPKALVIFGESPKGKTVKITLSQLVDVVTKWNEPIEAFQSAAIDVLTFSRPYLEGLAWDRVPEHILSLQEICQALGVSDFHHQLAVALALQCLPEERRFLDPEGTVGYKLDDELKRELTDLSLPIQGLKTNPALAMDAVRSILSEHPRFLRCGVEHPQTPDERIVVTFDFPDAVSEAERKKIVEEVWRKTGWPLAFSDSVKQDAFQPLIESLINKAIDTPSIYTAERRVMIKEQMPSDAEEIAAAFRQTTGFDLSFTDGDEPKTQQMTAAAAAAYRPSGNREPMEINQAIAHAKAWAAEQGVKIYKAGVKRLEGVAVMELHFITPEVAAHYKEGMATLASEIGMAVTYAKQPKQNEVIRLTKALVPQHWQMKGNPSLHIDKAVVEIKAMAAPASEEIAAISEAIVEQTGYTLKVNG